MVRLTLYSILGPVRLPLGSVIDAEFRQEPIHSDTNNSTRFKTSVGGEAFVFGEIQYHWCPIDAILTYSTRSAFD
jgi:hypothetical protein